MARPKSDRTTCKDCDKQLPDYRIKKNNYWCSKCEYHKRGGYDAVKHTMKKSYQRAKESITEYYKARQEDQKDGYTYVYYIPEHHYVGISCNIKSRMRLHRNQGRFTEGMEILARFEKHVDAHWFETMLHMRGYNGYSHARNN